MGFSQADRMRATKPFLPFVLVIEHVAEFRLPWKRRGVVAS